jgi:hypothetical protein
VQTLPCGHVAHAGTSLLCRHLLDAQAADDGIDHVRLFRGRGVEFDLCCQACDPQASADVRLELVEACEGCVSRALDSGSRLAWRGEPSVLERPEPVTVTSRTTPLPGLGGRVVDWTPAPDAPGSGWLLLSDAGRIVRWDADSGATVDLAAHSVPDEPGRQPWMGHRLRHRLHASDDGRFAAVVNDFGRLGQVLDLTTGAVTLELDGGEYCEETVPFSLTFARHAGRTVVVHRTAWNRLDVSDPATGELLTSRGPTSYSGGEEPPPHYLDYFHGALTVSPDGRWIADDGWVWHPVGIPVGWSLDAWLTGNVWESDDGPTRRHLGWRAYYWNHPTCWVGDILLALSGLGDDDEDMLPGVRVVDVVTGTGVLAFTGPTGDLFVHDGRLLSVSGGATHVWDPATGERTATLPDVAPARLHPGTGELAALTEDALVRWSVGPADRIRTGSRRPRP